MHGKVVINIGKLHHNNETINFRVNSFVTKSSGTWGGADKDLAKKVRGSKK